MRPAPTVREQQAQNGVKPVDYSVQNRQRIKYMQTLVKARELQKEEEANQVAFKMQRFADVESKVRVLCEAYGRLWASMCIN